MDDRKRITNWTSGYNLGRMTREKQRIENCKEYDCKCEIIKREYKTAIQYALFYTNGYFESEDGGPTIWIPCSSESNNE
jgi:hypothetical protein